MFEYFFTERRDLPEGLGFSLFDRTHLLWLLGIALLIFVICISFCRRSKQNQVAFAKHMAIAILVLELVKIVAYIVIGRFSLGYLPLHLCGLAVFVNLWHAFSGHEFPAEVSYALGLPGAVAGLVFLDWSMYPAMNFFSLQSFLIHALLISYPLMQVFSGRIRPRVRKLWMPVVFLVLTGFPLYFLNKAIGTNFMFLNYPSPGSPLVFFEELFGNPGYIIGFFFLLAVVWAVVYIPFYHVKVHSKN